MRSLSSELWIVVIWIASQMFWQDIELGQMFFLPAWQMFNARQRDSW